MQRRIKKNKNTASHAENLKKMGYTVTEDDDHIYAECEGVVQGDADNPLNLAEKQEDDDGNVTFRLNRSKLKEIVNSKQLLSYTTRCIVPSGGGSKTSMLFGGVLCSQLGPFSCLVTKNMNKQKEDANKERAARKAAQQALFDDIVNG